MSNPYLIEPAMITGVKQETVETKTFTLKLTDESRRLDFTPGQFNMVSLLGIGEGPFSIASPPRQDGSFDHTVRVVGSLTEKLDRLGAGDIVGLRGAYGRGWPVELIEGRDLLVVAGGVGLAPLRGLIELALERQGSFGALDILYGCRSPQDLIYTSEYARWQAAPGVNLFLTVDEVPPGMEWGHGAGVVTNLIGRSRIDFKNACALVCGPEIMMRFVARSLLMRDMPAENIFVSLERRMECGMAKCGRCMIGPTYVCSDGPVLPYAEAKNLHHSLLAADLKGA